MDLLDLTRTLVLPEMEPFTTMTILSLDSAAAVNCARDETVVVVPPVPPVVLHITVNKSPQYRSNDSNALLTRHSEYSNQRCKHRQC